MCLREALKKASGKFRELLKATNKLNSLKCTKVSRTSERE